MKKKENEEKMYQQSTDKANLSAKKDLMIFIGLVLVFFLSASVMMYMENKLDSMIPRYVFIGIICAGLYLFYRFRLIGYRYTIFYKEPELKEDIRFDMAMKAEAEYPYPVGTIIIERTVSAKGTILAQIDVKEIETIEKVESKTMTEGKSINAYIGKAENTYKLTYIHDGKRNSVIFTPDEEFLAHVNEAIENVKE